MKKSLTTGLDKSDCASVGDGAVASLILRVQSFMCVCVCAGPEPGVCVFHIW